MSLLKKLQFKSRYMGNKENDLYFESFANTCLPSFSEDLLLLYEKFLQENDLDLTQWVMGKEPLPEDYKDLALAIQQHYTALKERKQ